MKHLSIYRSLVCALAVILLVLSLPSCMGKMLYRVTVDDFTYTLRGVGDHVEQITVTRDGKRIGSYRKRGIKGELGGESYGFFMSDLNFDGHPDMFLLTGFTGTIQHYACYLWSPEQDTYLYDAALSALGGMEIDSENQWLTARDYTLTIDPATDDTPEFEIRKDTFSVYRRQNGIMTEVHRKELTYYEESDIYCYAIFEPDEQGEWESIRESWITADRFDRDKYPMTAQGYEPK